uniref:Uncharacterized protein n=2 Tax=Melittangium boletus TaxID=83453 RepID=A0A3Q8I608_9BACT|nr:hypothetical protein [Melittangium boletus]
MKHAFPLLIANLIWMGGCATSQPPVTSAPKSEVARGPWSEVAAVEMSTGGDASIPIDLLRDVADALLKRPGATVCDPVSRRPIVGLSTEYCSTVYVAGNRDSLSWRVTEPQAGNHESCRPSRDVEDGDHPASQVWVVGYLHNHPCGAFPSSLDLRAWPTDVFQPHVAMAEVRLIPGNPAPAVYQNTAIEMASALVAQLQDGTRVFLRYFPTGEIQQWSAVKDGWIPLGHCTPRRDGRSPQCDAPLRLVRE